MTPWVGAPWTPRGWQAAALPDIIAALKEHRQTLVSAVMGSGKSVLMSEIAVMATRNLGERAIVVVAPRQKLIRQLSGTFGARLGADNVGQYYGRRKQPNRQVIVCCAPSLPSLRQELLALGRGVGLLIVDEAHSSEGERLKETIPLMGAAAVVGFTATPFRSAPKETVSLFSNIAVRYTMDDATREGVLVPMRHLRYEGTAPPGEVDEVCVDMIREHGAGPGIVSARDIKDAEAYAEHLSAAGIPALAIHSRIKMGERERRLEQLRGGELRALVHVSLLAEGVDLPWLRWICLRRAVQARVRFLQEVGRVLRVDPESDKSEGVVMDPHLLLGRHNITTSEAIGKAMEEAAEAEELATPEERKRRAKERREEEVIALDLLLDYLRSVRRDMQRSRILPPDQINGGSWTIARPSDKQIETLGKVKGNTRHIPREMRDPIKALCKVPWAMTRGQVSELLDVLMGSRRWAQREAQRSELPPYRLQWSPAVVQAAAPDEQLVKTVSRMRR